MTSEETDTWNGLDALESIVVVDAEGETRGMVGIMAAELGGLGVTLTADGAIAYALELIHQAQQISAGLSAQDRAANARERHQALAASAPQLETVQVSKLTVPDDAGELVAASDLLEAAGLHYTERIVRMLAEAIRAAWADGTEVDTSKLTEAILTAVTNGQSD